MTEPLLHLTGPMEWRAAGRRGRYVVASLAEQGFLHLSTVDQVHLPANALFADRTDVLLLCVDPSRLDSPLRWEPGTQGDPAGMRFPHVYGAVPLRAVTAVVPYRPGPDGRYHRPSGLPEGPLARSLAFEHYLARAQSGRVVDVPRGFAVQHPEYVASWEHNRLIMQASADPRDVMRAADSVLGDAGLSYRHVNVDAATDDATERDYVAAGYRLQHHVLMVAGADAGGHPAGPVSTVDLDELRPMLLAGWAREVPGIDPDAARQLVDRARLAEDVVQVTHLAVAEGTSWVARADLFLDGATAQIEDVMTEPEHRRRGHATAIVLEALRRARATGCDLIFLRALAADWPRAFYRRLGFLEVGTAVELHREAVAGR